MKKKNLYFFIGTTAELIKLAPVIKELKKRKVNFKIISSNQNVLYFDELKPLIGKQEAYYRISFKPIKLHLNAYLGFIMWTAKALINFLLYFNKEFKDVDRKKSFFIVHGDTISSVIGALFAKIYGIRLVHIESGLRSFNFLEPFPEEICRYFVSFLTHTHFCPNSWAVNNLKNYKGIKINTFNNTLIESLATILKSKAKSKYADFPKKKFFLLVLHRQEHFLFKKNRAKNFINLFTEYADRKLSCIIVLHRLTKRFLKQQGLIAELRKNKNITFIQRLPYTDFVQVMRRAEFIATDGGSNQEESYYLGKPCIILRDVTERIEGLGENVLMSKGDENTVKDFIQNYKKYERPPAKFQIRPSKIIVDYLVNE